MSQTVAVTAPADARSERTRRALLDAAAQVWCRDATASLADVAQAAGVGRATLHRYFATRDDLLRALALDAIDRLSATIDACDPQHGSAPDVLRRVAEAVLPVADELKFLQAGWAVWGLPQLTERWYSATAVLEDVVRRGQAAGELRRDLPATWLSDVYAGLLITAADAVADGRLARREAPGLVVETLLGGIAP